MGFKQASPVVRALLVPVVHTTVVAVSLLLTAWEGHRVSSRGLGPSLFDKTLNKTLNI